jgi:cell division protein FtsB
MTFPTHIWHKLQSFGFVVCAGVVALGVALMFVPLLQKRSALQEEADRLDQELARQETVEREQLAEIQALRTDPAFVEKTAREKLNLARPDETVFRFEPRPEVSLPR